MWLMQFNHYLFGYVGTALCCIGLSLALCSVYVFTRRQMRSVVATYLAALSASDSCLLSLGLIVAINSSIPPHQQSELFYSSRLHKHLFPYVYPCIIWFQFTSVWITIAFAVDRWFAIKWPMLHYTYSSKRACYIVCTIYASGFIYSIPRFFEYKTEVQREELNIGENFTEYVDHLVITNQFLDNQTYHTIVHLLLYSLFQSILPLLMLSYFNVELIRSIHASSDFLKRFTSANGQMNRTGTIGADKNSTRYREGSVTRSVICLIGIFTLCQVPASILHYIFMFYRNHPILYICYEISNFLILLNSAVNFFIFTYYNRKFRRELTRICCQKENNRNMILNTSTRHSSRRQHSYLRQLQKTSSHGQHLPLTKNSSWDYPDRHSQTLEKTSNLGAKNLSDASLQTQYLQQTDSLKTVNHSKDQEIRSHDLTPRKPRHSTPNPFHSSSISSTSRRFTANRLSRHGPRSDDPLAFSYTTPDEKSLVIYSQLAQSVSTTTAALARSSINGRYIARMSLSRDRPRLLSGHERLRRSRTREIM